jgi:hypothetical protein
MKHFYCFDKGRCGRNRMVIGRTNVHLPMVVPSLPELSFLTLTSDVMSCETKER